MKGDRLGPYRVLGELGLGSTASVYLAEVVGEAPELEAGRRVALKLLHPQFESEPRALRRFLQEVQVGSTLRHENVVRLLDAGEVRLDGCTRHYLAMEYVQGSTIRQLITGQGGQPEGLCRHVGREVARGLAAIHALGAVHRDIKPENIVLTQDEHVKIMDLGVARLRGESSPVSRSGDFIGSVLYAPPEQFLGHSDRVDGRADLYALGLTLYELATGVHPFARDTIEEVMQLQLAGTPRRPGALRPDLSPFFEYVLLRMLRKSPAQRFPSAERLGRILEAAEDSQWWRERSRILRMNRRAPRPGPRIQRETSVYGRDAVLQRLRSLWADVTQGRGRVLVLSGEAGVGKSRVADEFAARLSGAGEDLHVLYGAWPAAGPGSHAGALRTAYREHFGPDRLEEELAPFLTETPVLLPAFAAFLRGEPSPPHAEHIGREALFTVFLQVARALALEKPTLLVLEDAHNATSEAREVVATLAHGIETSRVLLLLTERPGGTTAWSAELDRSPHATRLALGRLREQDVRHLLAEALGSAHLAARLAPRLTLLSDGNPLFLFEILQELRRSGTLAATDGDPTWTLRGTLRDVQAPPRLRDLVQARLAGLGTEEREVLDAAATFGFTFDPALLAEVLDRPRLRTLQVLGRLERTHGLVRSRGKHCTFDHHVLQETLYADLPPPLRRATHAAIGEALERGLRETAVDGASAVEACDHFLRADRAASALPWLDAALDHLEEGHLSARAADLMDRVLAVPGLLERSPRARLLLRKAERLRLLGRTADAARTLEEAARMASPKHDPLLASAASTRLADHLRAVGHPDRALAFLTRAIALAQSAGSPKAEAEATCCLGVALDGLGRYAEARDAQRRCLEYAQRAGDACAEARARVQLARALFRLSETDEALEELQTSATLFETAGGLVEQGSTAAELGSLLVALGRYDEARPQLERGLEIAQTVGHRAGAAAALGDLGALSQGLGDLGEASTRFDRSLAILRECGSPGELGLLLTQVGALELLVGRPGRARRALEEARQRLREIGHGVGEAWAVLHLARVEDEQRGHEAAAELFRRALELGERAGSPRDQAVMRVHWALGFFWQGETKAAARVLYAGGAAWRSTESRDALLLGRALELALGRGGAEAAVRRLLGPPTTPAARYEAHALLHVATRDPGDLEAAWRGILELRERAPAETWSSFLGGTRVRRRVREAWEAQHASSPRLRTE